MSALGIELPKSDLVANVFIMSLDVNLTLNIKQELKELRMSGGVGCGVQGVLKVGEFDYLAARLQ